MENTQKQNIEQTNQNTDIVAQQTNDKKLYCKFCGNEIIKGNNYCSTCGRSTNDETKKHCPNCGAILENGQKFCSTCGCKIEFPAENIANQSQDENAVKRSSNTYVNPPINGYGWAKNDTAKVNYNSQLTTDEEKWYEKTAVIILFLILFFPVGLFLMWKYANWNKTIKISITVLIAIVLIVNIFGGKSNSDDSQQINSSKTVSNYQQDTTNTTKESANNVAENKTANTNVETVTNTENSNVENSNTELKFIAPVAGEISKDFADDTLAYSNTLEEWTTHLGIDIKAERTSVVVASEAGKVESIKNDPRYGLTITIDHGNNYKTVYSNLLTTEFVQTGETVEKGQTIATVGDTASFEVLDEPHLHFEMYLDGKAVNPTLYFK